LPTPSATIPPSRVAAEPGIPDKPYDPPDLKRAETVDAGHGRIETRRIAVRTKLPSRLDEKWQGVTAICRIERIRELKACCTREVIYAITSLPEDKLEPATLLQLARDHWQIENRLHHVRDVSANCRSRSEGERFAFLTRIIHRDEGALGFRVGSPGVAGCGWC